MNISDFDFSIDGYLFKSTKPTDFIVQSSIVPLFNKYKSVITDDYWVDSPETFLRLIQIASPYFWSCFNENGTFVGYMFLLDWKSSGTCCEFHIVIDEKYHGQTVHKVAKKVSKELFSRFNIKRIACTIPCYNKKTIAFAKRVLGAKFEGIHRAFSLKNGKPLDYHVYALLDTD